VSRTRQLVQKRLEEAGSAVSCEVAVLLTSELVTNAILHGAPPLRLRVEIGPATLRVEVEDARLLDTLAARTAAGDAESGRGLVLVEALGSRWGWESRGPRKCVWFELDA